MASSCFGLRRSKSKDVYTPSVSNGFRKRTESNLSTESGRSQRTRRGSEVPVPQGKEKNGAITFESASGKVVVIPDARIPLTPRQRYVLMKNWKGVSGRIAYTGITMLVRLFEQNQDFCSAFASTNGKTLPTDSAMENKLERHAHAIIQVFDDAIKTIGDGTRFFGILKKHAQTHSKIRNFDTKWFQAIEQPFLCAVKITLDSYYTEQLDHIYRVAVSLIIETLAEECEHGMIRSDRPR